MRCRRVALPQTHTHTHTHTIENNKINTQNGDQTLVWPPCFFFVGLFVGPKPETGPAASDWLPFGTARSCLESSSFACRHLINRLLTLHESIDKSWLRDHSTTNQGSHARVLAWNRPHLHTPYRSIIDASRIDR